MTAAGRANYAREVLETEAARARSLVDLMGRVGAPLGNTAMRYLERRLVHYGIDTTHFRAEPLPPRAKRSYTKEALTEAAAHSHSVREVVAYLGDDRGDIPYTHVRSRLLAFGIDISHFGPPRRRRSDAPSRPAIESAIAEATGLAEALRLLGLAVTGAQRARLNRWVAEYGLSTAHHRGQGHGLGKGAERRTPAEAILVRKPPGSSRTRAAMLRRALDEIGRSRCCAVCGTGENWHGVRLVLEVDHINGDWRDNRAHNLRYLCPCCHSQTETYSGRRNPRQ